jgi:hypothetical protein
MNLNPRRWTTTGRDAHYFVGGEELYYNVNLAPPHHEKTNTNSRVRPKESPCVESY